MAGNPAKFIDDEHGAGFMNNKGSNNHGVMTRSSCLAKLADHEKAAARDPLTNSVHLLAHDLFRALEGGALQHESLLTTATQFCDEALFARADRFTDAHAGGVDWSALVSEVLRPLSSSSFDDAKTVLEQTRAGIVFTAHPTFAMSEAMRRAVAQYASASSDEARKAAAAQIVKLPHKPDEPIALRAEHDAAGCALERAQSALRVATIEILRWAQRRYPDQWTQLTPAPVSLATWVGYDLDGRTDIHWAETFRIRLDEKTTQLKRYGDALRAIDLGASNKGRDRLADRLSQSAALAAEQVALFDADLNDADIVVAAANKLTRDDPRRMTSLNDVIADLNALMADTVDEDAQLALCALRAEMTSYGLGVGRIHLRINAAQVRSALRADLGMGRSQAFGDRTTLNLAAEKAAVTTGRRINTASIFKEQMTARRQLMLCAQFLKHIDADTPIRFLIAECEAPATVMGAIYLAKLYGVDHRVDISPLFETPEAIEAGGRFIERLLAEDEFAAYIRARGRMAIQIGFSDSGRFMGQVAANLAIERLQILAARALAAKECRDVEIVIFNTHGESMGRGGFPGDLKERFDYLMTPWARSRFQHEGLALNAECSFQGGDGYLHFETDHLAAATLAALLKWSHTPPAPDADDLFYADLNYSWDFYRNLKSWQETLFDDPDYHVAIGAFAPDMLFTTGSRKTRRQSGGELIGPRSLRAIPHNAILQQLAAPANVFGGIGSATGAEGDKLLDHIKGSERMRAIIAIAHRSRRLASLPALRGYAALYDASFWSAKAATDDADTATLSAEIAARLADLKIPTAISRYANLLAGDLAKFDRILRELKGDDTDAKRYEGRRSLHALHAIRQALMMRGLMLAASLPSFSQRHDVSRKTVFELAFALKFDQLADLLNEIFPASSPDESAFNGLDEPEDSDDSAKHGYLDVQRNVIAPLRDIHQAIREIGVGIAHSYGAYG